MFRKSSRSFTIPIVIVLAVSTSVTYCIVAFAYNVYWKALSFNDAENIVAFMSGEASRSRDLDSISLPHLNLIESQATSFENLGGFSKTSSTLFLEGQFPERVVIATVTSDFFQTLGVRAFKGRVFSADETTASVAVVNLSLWTRLGGEGAGIGRVLTLDDK